MDQATIENLHPEWKPQDLTKTRSLKVILLQVFAALTIFLVNLSHEMYQPIMYLAANSHDIGSKKLLSNSVINVEFSSIMCIGLLLGGAIAHFIGPRPTVVLAGITAVLGWIILACVSSTGVLTWTFYIVIFTKAMMQAPAYVYLAEISQPNMRNPIMAVMYVAANIGSIYIYLPFAESIGLSAFFGVVFGVVGLVGIFFFPDSPYWLANKGRYREVESSLAWFRGRTLLDNVECESKAIISNVQSSPTAVRLFGQKSFYLAALIVGYVFLVTASVRIFYASYFGNIGIIMFNLGYRGDINVILTLFGFYTILISIFFVSLITVVGKRIMIIISLYGGGMALLVAAIGRYMRGSETLSIEAYSWFVLICLLVSCLSLLMGLVPIPLLLNGELFPSKIRNLGAAFGLFFGHIVQVVIGLIYGAIFSRSEPGAVLFLALLSIVCCAPLWWLFPQNENKSLVEIERSSASINELRSRK